LHHPLESLQRGNWFKLICGASFQHLPAIHNLALAYTLAGVDCIDVAADPVVVASTRKSIDLAVSKWLHQARSRGYPAYHPPWLMVSLNDGEDPHFRKAQFDPHHCPSSCPRPCERVCPTQAIVFPHSQDENVATHSGVIEEQCYGCGRCLLVCPIQHITTRSYVSTPASVAPLVLQGVDAVEIHTQVGRLADFCRLWSAIAPYLTQLKLIAISCPQGEGMVDYLWALHDQISSCPCPVIWQTDGRPMSGDIGDGTTHAAIKLGQAVLAAGPPGYVQLAGGTNRHTVTKLKSLGLLNPSLQSKPEQVSPLLRQRRYVAGVAYGSYARGLLAPLLDSLRLRAESTVMQPTAEYEQNGSSGYGIERLEEYPDLLWQAVELAYSLTSALKAPERAMLPPDRDTLSESRPVSTAQCNIC
jgi:Fe-S-cluster-containing hydrogenase component 2